MTISMTEHYYTFVLLFGGCGLIPLDLKKAEASSRLFLNELIAHWLSSVKAISKRTRSQGGIRLTSARQLGTGSLKNKSQTNMQMIYLTLINC